MLYIIGGLPRTGKTLIGSILIKQTGCYAVDTDHIRALFGGDPDSKISFGKNTYSQATTAIKPYIENLVEYFIGQERDYALCGEILDPASLAKFNDSCKICFLGFSDSEKHFIRVQANQHQNDWVSDINNERLKQIFKEFSQRSAQLKADCKRLGISYFDMSSEDFALRVRTIIESLTGERTNLSFINSAIAQYMRS